ncbi:aldehyde dehydrogenase family protein [Psychrobacter proteolyticus]|uniref:aldehyde dehydrogenase family protein n=1 Tax=Psychrobacter proteolyticus TaxID=147825 RepID=UPI003D015088
MTIISPFNFPLVLVMRSVVTALASGNAVLLKPASTTFKDHLPISITSKYKKADIIDICFFYNPKLFFKSRLSAIKLEA